MTGGSVALSDRTLMIGNTAANLVNSINLAAPGTVTYRGVPYCEQPVPPRRFCAVEPLAERWSTPRPCFDKPPIAPQPLAPQLAVRVAARA